MAYLIECPQCEAVVNAEVRGQIQEGPTDEGGGPWLVTLAECPQCQKPVVGFQEYISDEDGNISWTDPARLWPFPPVSISLRIPTEIRISLEEAQKCLRCQAHTASVVMSGRALEGVGRHFYPSDTGKGPMLGAGLKKLYEDKIIDTRLYEWGKTLTEDRNLAAHPSGIHLTRDDAADVFKFASSICEYVFVLSKDFEEYMERRTRRLRHS